MFSPQQTQQSMDMQSLLMQPQMNDFMFSAAQDPESLQLQSEFLQQQLQRVTAAQQLHSLMASNAAMEQWRRAEEPKLLHQWRDPYSGRRSRGEAFQDIKGVDHKRQRADVKKGGVKNACFSHNSGSCHYGSDCRFEHICSDCGDPKHVAGTNRCNKKNGAAQVEAPSDEQESNRQKKKSKKSGPATKACFAHNKGTCNYGALCKFEHTCSNCGVADHVAGEAQCSVKDGVEIKPEAPLSSTMKVKNACFKWQKGDCTFGVECKFEHKCSECGAEDHVKGNEGCSVKSTVAEAAVEVVEGVLPPAEEPMKSKAKKAVKKSRKGNACFAHQKNECERGDDCKFLHVCSKCGVVDHVVGECEMLDTNEDVQGVAPVATEKEESKPKGKKAKQGKLNNVCFAYQKGACIRGDCKFLHVCSKCGDANHGKGDESCPKKDEMDAMEVEMPEMKVKNACYKHNRGACKFGTECKFEHKCSKCGDADHVAGGEGCPGKPSS
eukprot:gene16629-19753_t